MPRVVLDTEFTLLLLKMYNVVGEPEGKTDHFINMGLLIYLFGAFGIQRWKSD